MGKHADPDASSFYRSFASSVLRAAAVAGALLAVVLLIAWANLKGGEQADATAVLGEQTTRATRDEPAAATQRRRSQQPTAVKPAEAGKAQQPSDQRAVAQAQPPGQTSVQVLDGVGDDARTRRVVNRLESLGYQIVAVNPSARDYDVTTVLYSDGYEREARALHERDGRFRQLAPNPNLAESVHLHVVVGSDWP